ncbi:MAG: sarcosine oxidase subunit gamma [Proteobacteria bacterium]|nr:sarcosine oxidase subunit gamma [Pseudomonadota bacterium]
MSDRRAAARGDRNLKVGWREGPGIVNLRGDPSDAAFTQGAARALGLALPLQACTSVADEVLRVLWAGPDDWFVIAPRGRQAAFAAALRAALAGTHHAVTDVSSGYHVLQLGGAPARELLAQGCPLDLHPRAFRTGDCKGSHFFKAAVWLWQTDAAPSFELLVRRSFAGYVELMLGKAGREWLAA